MTKTTEVLEARTAILRAVSALMPADLPPEHWRNLGDLVDDQLHVAWAAGYVIGTAGAPVPPGMGMTA